MALTNSQYEQIMRTYEQHRLDNEHRRRRRYADIEKKIPRIRELDDEISSLSLQQARRLLEGDASALDTLKEKIHALSKKSLHFFGKTVILRIIWIFTTRVPTVRIPGISGTENATALRRLSSIFSIPSPTCRKCWTGRISTHFPWNTIPAVI